jgi:hypothetical protein
VRKRVRFSFIRGGTTVDRQEGGNKIWTSVEYGGISLLAEWLCIGEKDCFSYKEFVFLFSYIDF